MQRLNYTGALSRTNEPETLLWDRTLFYYGFYDETNLASARRESDFYTKRCWKKSY